MPKNEFVIRRLGDGSVTAVQACSSRRFSRHTHNEFGIGIILRGAQQSWSGRGNVEAKAGDMISVNPGEVHDGAPVGAKRSWSMLYISPHRMTDIVSDMTEGRTGHAEFFDPVIADDTASSRFAAAYCALSSSVGGAAEEQLMLLVGRILNFEASPIARRLPALDRIKARVDDDPAGHHPLHELARDAGLSRFQTLRDFARFTGFTPHAYMVQRRLDLARTMLRRGSQLADAAYLAGFADQSHFHRMFSRRYGLTPGAFASAVR